MNVTTLVMNNTRRQFVFRPDGSDQAVMQQVFRDQHYDLSRLIRYRDIAAYLTSMEKAGGRPLIVDAGANIGASSVYLALTFPSARVVALEPEPGNFALLVENVAGLNVRCIHAAISAHPGRTRLSDPGIGAWGFRTDPHGPGPEVAAITMAEILQEHGQAPYFPFFVKLDIEGGEKELFNSNTDWVADTPVLVAELHDWLFPQQGTALPFLRCVSALNRDFIYRGENVFSIANDFLTDISCI